MILVTGATGFLGSHLLVKLLQNTSEPIVSIYRSENSFKQVKQVFSFYTNDVEQLFSKIKWVKGDILDVVFLDSIMSTIKTVYHLAALVSFEKKDRSQLRKINIEGTANVVNSCIEHQVDCLCHVSSIATLDKNEKQKLVNEKSTWNPEIDSHMYGISKFGAEMEVWRGSQEGLRTIIVNPGVILGSGFWNRGSSRLILKIKNGLYFFPMGGTGFIGVEDVAKCMLGLVASSVENEKFILISENLTFKEVVFLVSKHLNVKALKIKLTTLVLYFVWILQCIISLFFSFKNRLTRNSILSMQSITKYDNDKIKQQLNFKFAPIDNVLKNTVENLNKNI